MISQEWLDAAVEESYKYAHDHCHYAPTDNSFPVGEDGRMDCTGLMLRALYLLGLVDYPLNCDQIDMLMGRLGFVQWCYPHVVGTEHVNHTYYSLGGDGRTISKYDTGSETRLRSAQPFDGVPVDEWGGRLVFKHMWRLRKQEQQAQDHGIFLQIGGD